MKKIVIIFLILGAFSASAQTSTTYIYDSIDRLKSVTYSNGTTVTYNYDKVGNRTSEVITAAICPSPIESLKSGNWDDSSVWSCGTTPIITDIVKINLNHDVIVLNGVTASYANLILIGNIILNTGSNIQMKGN